MLVILSYRGPNCNLAHLLISSVPQFLTLGLTLRAKCAEIIKLHTIIECNGH